MLISALLPCRLLVTKLAPSLALFLSHPSETPADQAPAQPVVAAESHAQDPIEAFEMCPNLIEAVRIAKNNANPRATRYCWRYVKRALLAADAVDSYPEGVSAKYAGAILTDQYGFIHLDDITDPEDAPVGAVLVYGGAGHGHIEIRTENGYVSDFTTRNHSKRPLTGVYVKLDDEHEAPAPPADPDAMLDSPWFILRERVGAKVDEVLSTLQPIVEKAMAESAKS